MYMVIWFNYVNVLFLLVIEIILITYFFFMRFLFYSRNVPKAFVHIKNEAFTTKNSTGFVIFTLKKAICDIFCTLLMKKYILCTCFLYRHSMCHEYLSKEAGIIWACLLLALDIPGINLSFAFKNEECLGNMLVFKSDQIRLNQNTLDMHGIW